MKQRFTLGERAIHFYSSLKLREKLPRGIRVMDPYQSLKIVSYLRLFFHKFFPDDHPRVLVFGINPGRFGAGTTGITFTDPVALEKFCGVPNDLPKKRELSSVFIYQFIERWGGAEKFYQDFYLTAVSPLGFVRGGRNYNFYDNPELLRNIHLFLIQSIRTQLAFGARKDVVIVLGTGKIKKIFEDLNREYRFFQKVFAVEHPRFIMQYRRRKLPYYLSKYQKIFLKALSRS